MRWIKHMTMSHLDEKLSILIEEMGMHGYGAWWIILERIAMQVTEDSEPTVRLSLRVCSQLLKTHLPLTKKTLNTLHEIGLVIVNYVDDKYVELSVPNIIKYRDEWTRKKSNAKTKTPELLRSDSGDCQESLRCKEVEVEVEVETEVERENTPPIVPPTGGNGTRKKSRSSKSDEVNQAIERELFGSDDDPIGLDDEPAVGIWQLWIPSRRGTKEEVRKAYKQVRKPDNVAAIRAGVEEFMRSLYVTSRIETGNAEFIKHLATWLRARGWEEAGTGAWDEPCQEWKRIHASEQPGFNYNGPCRVINFAPRDGTLG